MPAYFLPHAVSAALALAACFLFAMVPVMRWNLNYDAFINVLTRLIDGGDLARARKLSAAAARDGSGALVAVAAERALARAMSEEAGLDALAEAMACGVVDALAILRRWRLIGAAALALELLSAAIGLAYSAPAASAGWLFSAFGLVLLLSGARAWFGIRTQLEEVPVDLLAPLLAARGDEATAEQIAATVQAHLATAQTRAG